MLKTYDDQEGLIKSMPDLRGHTEFMALEDFSTIITGIKKYFTDTLPAVSKIFSTNASRAGKIDKEQYNSFLKTIYELEKDIGKIEKLPYSEVENIKVPVMLGMRTDLLNTVTILSQASEVVNDNLLTLVEYTDIFVSLVMSDKDFRTASRVNYSRIKESFRKENKNTLDINSIEHVYDKLQNYINQVVDPKNHYDQRSIKQLIPNISSLYHIQSILLETAKSNTLENVELLEKEVGKISSRIDTLYDYISSDEEFEINKQVLNELASTLESTGKAITSAVTIWYLINQSSVTTRFLVDGLLKRV